MGSTQSFQNLQIDPATNPAIIDTVTWEREGAWQVIRDVGEGWRLAQTALRTGCKWSGLAGVSLASPSAIHRGAAEFCLVGLPDGQQVFLEIGQGGGFAHVGDPIGEHVLAGWHCDCCLPH